MKEKGDTISALPNITLKPADSRSLVTIAPMPLCPPVTTATSPVWSPNTVNKHSYYCKSSRVESPSGILILAG